jgi:hypothetical protein
MNTNTPSRVQRWQPPIRPEWVERINAEGRCLDLKGVVPLDENSLIRQAIANTGLTDFGADDWREPFQVFIKALDAESDLTLMGRLMTRSDILSHLEARLRIEDTYRKNPQIADLDADSPVWIVGSGRSGTSAMINYLSLDPDMNSVRTWEAMFPCPPPEAATYETDPRIAIADQRMEMWNRVTPETASMHEFNALVPTELIHVEALSFQSNGWLDLYGFVPSLDAYLKPQNYLNGLNYAKRVLKLLQWKNPRRRWVIKSPDCMRYLPQVFEVFPGTQLVWMHRDPIKCVASMVSLVGTLFHIRSDQPLSEQAIAQLTNCANLAAHFGRVIDQVDAGAVPAGALLNVQYLDFVADTIGTIDKLYAQLGIPFTDRARTAMEHYHRAHPREARPAHRYAVGEAAQVAAERKLFERYQTRFGVVSEAAG